MRSILSVGSTSKLISDISPNPKLPPELNPIVRYRICLRKITTGTIGKRTRMNANKFESFINFGRSKGNNKVKSNKKTKPYAIK